MSMIETLVGTPFSEAIAWSLVHSSWQGTIAAAVLMGCRGAKTRYAVGCLLLPALVITFGVTFWLYLPRYPAAGMPAHTAPEATRFAWLTPLWIAGVLAMQLRVAAGWVAARRMRDRAVCEAPGQWRETLVRLAARMRVSRPVRLLESGLAKMPCVVGHLRPAILVPAGFLASMPPEHIEWILLHELAHIRRRDYLVNLLQSMAEGLFFHHPAIWWISKVIREEREHCCDDLAVAAGANGDAHEYARALVALEQSRGDDHLSAANMAATGGNLMKRVQRLLYPPQATTWPFTPLVTAAVMIAIWQVAAISQNTDDADPYRRWVSEDVVYIIDAREREAFVALKTNDEREHFIEQFWQRRDPSPGTPKNEFKEEHYRRISVAWHRFTAAAKTGWKTDRGRIYILHGPPDEIESQPKGRDGGPASEQWLYRNIQGVGNRVIIEFTDSGNNGDYRQTTDPRNRR